MEVKKIKNILENLKDSDHIGIEIGDIWDTDFTIEKIELDEDLYMGLIKFKMLNKEIMEHLRKSKKG